MNPPDFVFGITAKDGITEFAIEGDDHIITAALVMLMIKNANVYNICSVATQIYDGMTQEEFDTRLASMDVVLEATTKQNVSDN